MSVSKTTTTLNSVDASLFKSDIYIPQSISAIKETLESRGVWAQLKAGMRAEVFSALDHQGRPRPPLSHENLLINELIREYLEFNKYRYTASVLTAGGSNTQAP